MCKCERSAAPSAFCTHCNPPKKVPHKHAELIKAWADGAKIEYRLYESGWKDIKHPTWLDYAEYRIKPEPKSDVEKYLLLGKDSNSGGHHVDGVHSFPINVKGFSCVGLSLYKPCNVIKLTFDGETGLLKKTEIVE